MPGRRNPISMTGFVEKLGDAVKKAKTNAHDFAETHARGGMSFAGEKTRLEYVDITIQFIGANGLPRMDVVGSADPYFVAKLDDRISFVSTVKTDTLTPVWNELWRVKNVPEKAELNVQILDKDVGAPHDDYIGQFKTTISPGAKELEIEGPLFRRNRGTFWLKIDSTPSLDPNEGGYLFAGPIRYSRHFSPTIGRLTNLDSARLYSTWKMYITDIPTFFGSTHQPWNSTYKAAQQIFGPGPTSLAIRSGIQAGHRLLYARSTQNSFGTIESASDILDILHSGSARPGAEPPAQAQAYAGRVKPAVYTYIISSEDDSLRFSETGAAFFVDFASKHALHSNCFPTVRYSGEFHPRPQGGWDQFSDSTPDAAVNWELVIDNNSGTYSPDPEMLPALRGLLEKNFPGFKIYALDFKDPELARSRDACREYALKFRGVRQEELQPHAGEGEETLMHQAKVGLGSESPQSVHV